MLLAVGNLANQKLGRATLSCVHLQRDKLVALPARMVSWKDRLASSLTDRLVNLQFGGTTDRGLASQAAAAWRDGRLVQWAAGLRDGLLLKWVVDWRGGWLVVWVGVAVVGSSTHPPPCSSPWPTGSKEGGYHTRNDSQSTATSMVLANISGIHDQSKDQNA